MTLVGFKRMTIGVFDETGNIPTDKRYVVEGKENEGATVSAEISGLSKEATKVYGSNVAYYISQKGTGDVSITFGLLDIPEEVNDEILGYKTGDNGVSYLGENTEPPYCAVLLESEDLGGDTALLAIFKGKFSREAINLNTTTNEAFEPDAEEYVFSAIANDAEGEAKGQTVGKYVGSDETAINLLKTTTFPGNSMNENVAITGVTLDNETLNVTVGSTAQLNATVTPVNATNKTVTYESSDEAIATVSNSGLVSGVAAGNATVTVTTNDGDKTATCAVTVTAA